MQDESSKDGQSLPPRWMLWLQHGLPTIQDRSIMELELRNMDFDFNVRDPDGKTVLHLAVENCREEIVKLLLESKHVDVNAQERVSGYTALHLTAFYGHTCDRDVEISELLLNNGAKMNTVDHENGETPLHLVSRSTFAPGIFW